ncbi:uncharacterized protein si:ch211-195m9.3 isoform X2 [Dicentrarchus labrax]|uniref:uncharacterized protein si:ch211-195m9.3 isoform X2 n=1 Tax=Dicentrarchus labrax TaxID=13489 RepID=UPI0021F61C56|nr:uncharacterized protein si:ch211-195m9.3 isoform X2 [Dicentrarchus labrax]
MRQTGSQMLSLWALALVWLVWGSPTFCGSTPGPDASAKNACYRKTCGNINYDIREAVCCENRLHSGAGLSCCGGEPFNPAKATCCTERDGHPKPKTALTLGLSQKVSDCCGLNAFNPLNEICCESTVVPKPVPKAECCGKEAIDVDKQMCCGKNRTILTRKSIHHQCCGSQQFNTTSHCCSPINGSLQILEKSNSSGFANKSDPVDVNKQMRCSPSENPTILCCGLKQYNTKTHCCCVMNDTLMIHPWASSCCKNDSGVQKQQPEPQSNCTELQTSLCGSSCYNPNEFRCCERNQTKSKWCCGPDRCDAAPTVYNPHTQVCCDGCVSERKPWMDQFHATPGQHCCGTEVYRPHIEMCCDGHRHPKENMQCCGVKAYNISNHQMKCCAGTLYNLTSLGTDIHTARCCGSLLQKAQDVCCSHEDKELLYSAKTRFRCCGHLYYNTSLWSCCADKLSPLHQPGHHQNKMILSLNNLNETDLCKEMLIGTVDSVSLHSIVFRSVLKIHGRTMIPLPSPHILKKPDRCNFPKLIHGKTYFFNEVNVFTDFNHDSILQSFHFITSKCSQVTSC